MANTPFHAGRFLHTEFICISFSLIFIYAFAQIPHSGFNDLPILVRLGGAWLRFPFWISLKYPPSFDDLADFRLRWGPF